VIKRSLKWTAAYFAAVATIATASAQTAPPTAGGDQVST
jgi:hypothetical protein